MGFAGDWTGSGAGRQAKKSADSRSRRRAFFIRYDVALVGDDAPLAVAFLSVHSIGVSLRVSA